MTAITSGTTTGRLVRISILAAVFTGYAAWCYYDWYVRYPQRTLAWSEVNLPKPPAQPLAINRKVHSGVCSDLKAGMPFATVSARLGEPGWRDAADVRYFGPGGVLLLNIAGDKLVRDAEWKEPHHGGDYELKWQLGMALGLTPLSLGILGYYLFRVLGFRCRLSDAGLEHPGHPRVTFEQMRSLEYYGPERLQLTYDQAGTERTIILDEYKIKAFDEIVDNICARTAFKRPEMRTRPADSTAGAG